MKKTSLITMIASVMFSLPMSTNAQEERTVDVTYLVLTENSGAVSRFALSDSPEMSFSDGNLVVACQGDELTTSLADVKDYTFVVEHVSTGINSIPVAEGAVASQQPTFSFRDAKINGLKAGARVGIYSINGTLVSNINADAQGAASINLNNLPKGVYILRTPNKSFKIINR